ncbi:MAG TPA: thiopurine S-methyltransferase [Rhodanobacteraceae bacterium]|jgi:thiopurine S-methyltransferase|nr:thiopurine S-methyltransferase [Rhodanobacteraceae bacterium]
MDAEFWLQRWREGRTGWHRDAVMPLLERYWPASGVAPGARVLVPLCGKSLDMLWLSQQGHDVLGVELSPVAVEAFLRENQLTAGSAARADGTHFKVTNPPGGSIEIINGDLFDVAPETIASCHAFYDRAAMIALPAPVRARMASEVYARLPADSRGLLIVLDYPQHEMEGPPFSVDADEVQSLLAAQWQVTQLERRDIFGEDPSFAERGATAMHTSVYALSKQPGNNT